MLTEFYLVTGFLGSGKTTFLKEFLGKLAPKRIHLIINEFGREGVDGTLLKGLGAVLDEINNGSIFCSCRLDQFEGVLTQTLQNPPDVIVAEASGLSDPTNIRRVLGRFEGIDYCGSICLADAQRLPKVFHTAMVAKRQLAVSRLVLLNKTDLATPEELEHSRSLIAQASPRAQICETQFGRIQGDWLPYITPNIPVEEGDFGQDITLQKKLVAVSPTMTKGALEKFLYQLRDSTYRMKGLVTLAEGNFLVDCTGPYVEIKPWVGETTGHIALLAGRGMPLRRDLKQAVAWYESLVEEVNG